MGDWQGELESSLPLLQGLMDPSLDHVYLYDRDLRYLFASAGGPAALGLTPEDFVGKHWSELGFPPEVMEPFEAMVREVFETGAPEQADTSFPLPSGTGWFHYVVHPVVDTHGIVQAVMAIVRDVTARRQAEQAVAQLSGLLPICAYCKNIRDGGGCWHRIEAYVARHSSAQFTHSVCPSCEEEHFPQE